MCPPLALTPPTLTFVPQLCAPYPRAHEYAASRRRNSAMAQHCAVDLAHSKILGDVPILGIGWAAPKVGNSALAAWVAKQPNLRILRIRVPIDSVANGKSLLLLLSLFLVVFCCCCCCCCEWCWCCCCCCWWGSWCRYCKFNLFSNLPVLRPRSHGRYC